ncbi:MAG: T9SS type B sorting domain-containing protein, partial [Bacteroidota bacterium]
GVGTFSYAWNDPNLQILEDAVFLPAGTYTLVATDENNCTETIIATVEEPTPLSVTYDAMPVACLGEASGSATAIPMGGNGGYSFNWETGSMMALADNLLAGEYALTITDAKGCTLVDSVTIGEPTAGLVTAVAQDQQGCAGESLNIATATAMGGEGPYNFLWPNGQTTATGTNLAAGENIVVITDNAGCVDSLTIDLVDLEPITFNLIATSPSCNGLADGAMGLNQLTGGAAVTDDQYSYAWSSGSFDIVAPNLIGGQTYTLTVTDQQGCTGVESRLLEDPAPILLSADSLPVSCFGLTDGSISITSITGPNPGGYDIQWSSNAGSSVDSTVAGLGAGVYSVEVTDTRGCILTRTFTVTQPDLLVANFAEEDVTCFGDVDGQIITTVTGGVPSYNYNWSNGMTTADIASLPAGTYDLTLTDANGCELIEAIEIEEPDPVIAAAASEDVVCFGDATGRIQITATGGREPYTYSIDNTGFTRNQEFIGIPAGTYTAFVRDVGGCVGTTQITVDDGPEFVVDLGPDIDLIFGDSINLTPNFSGAVDSISFFWRGSYNGTLLCRGDSIPRELSTVVNCQRPNVRPEYEIDYTLLMVDGNGCEAEDRIRVRVEKIRVAEVPTAFTPNNDLQNDLLIVHGRPGTTVGRFMVLDRWGEVIYEDEEFPVNDMSRGWDGTYKGEPVNSGSYVWQMLVRYEDGSEEVLSGETSLIR